MADSKGGSAMLGRHQKALKELDGILVEAGWFESDRYPSTTPGEAGIPVAAIARQNEYGATIQHPGGTKYIEDAIVGKGANQRYVGTRFVSNDFAGEHKTTAAHTIDIPARPFMRLAWSNFLGRQAALQRKMAKELLSGNKSATELLKDVGQLMEGLIAKAIKNGSWTPNAASTIRKKGFNKPLIHDSIMLQTVSSQVTKKGET